MMVKDCDAVEKLMDTAEALLADPEKISKLENNILLLGRKDAGEVIAREVLKLAGR